MSWLKVLAFLLLPSLALAQSSPGFVSGQSLPAAALDAAFTTKMDLNGGAGANTMLTNPSLSGGSWTNAALNGGNLSGTFTGGTLSGTTLVNATFIGATGIPNEIPVACGTSSTTLLTAGSATAFIAVKLPATAAGPVWFNWAGTAAVAAAPSVDVSAGAEIVWSSANGFLPTAQVNCIASGSPVTVTLLWK